jgi:hypothetical protein
MTTPNKSGICSLLLIFPFIYLLSWCDLLRLYQIVTPSCGGQHILGVCGKGIDPSLSRAGVQLLLSALIIFLFERAENPCRLLIAAF